MSDVRFGQADCPEPGFYPDVPYHVYEEWNAVRWSLLRVAGWSMEKLKFALDNPERWQQMETTAAMVRGSAFHCALFQPNQFAKRYTTRPAEYPRIVSDEKGTTVRRADKTGSQFVVASGRGAKRSDGQVWITFTPEGTPIVQGLPWAKERVRIERLPWTGNATFCRHWLSEMQEKGLTILDRDDMTKARGMATRLNELKAVQRILDGAECEVSIVWTDPQTQLPCKARLDVSTTECQIADAKSTSRRADEESFAHEIARYRYYGQAAMYWDGLKAVLRGKKMPLPEIPVFMFLVCEEAEPHTPALYEMYDTPESEWFQAGRELWHGYLQRLRFAIEHDWWPGHGNENPGTEPDFVGIEVPPNAVVRTT